LQWEECGNGWKLYEWKKRRLVQHQCDYGFARAAQKLRKALR